MSILSKLFGSQPKPEKVEVYQGFTIKPQPMQDGGQFRLAALIEKGGQSHHLIRADTFASAEEANAAAIVKAKQLIGQMGERLF